MPIDKCRLGRNTDPLGANVPLIVSPGEEDLAVGAGKGRVNVAMFATLSSTLGVLNVGSTTLCVCLCCLDLVCAVRAPELDDTSGVLALLVNGMGE